MSKEVTVIMPIYNAEQYLEESLGSIDRGLANVITYDDCSTDDSLSIARDFSDYCIASDCRLGQGIGKNACIDYMLEKNPTKYVMFLDADDLFSKDAIEKALSIIGDRCLGVFGSRTFGETSRPYGKIKLSGEYLLTEEVSMSLPCVAWDKIYSTESIENVRFGASIPEDNVFWFTYCCKNHGRKVFCTDDVLHNYRQTFGGSYWLQQNRMNPLFDAMDSFLRMVDWINFYETGAQRIERLKWLFASYFENMIKLQAEKKNTSFEFECEKFIYNLNFRKLPEEFYSYGKI